MNSPLHYITFAQYMGMVLDLVLLMFAMSIAMGLRTLLKPKRRTYRPYWTRINKKGKRNGN